MTPRIFKTCLLSLTLLSLAAGAAWAEPGPPVMVVKQPDRSLGTVAPEQKITEVFTVSNEGGEPLTVDVRTTCGCTVANWDKTVAPGATGEIHATLDTTGMRGELNKAILVLTNDPQNPTQRLVITGEVQPVLEILPRPMIRMDTIQGTPASATVVVAPVDGNDEPFSVSAVTSNQPYLTVAAHALTGDGGNEQADRYEIEVKLGPEAPVGLLNLPVTVTTTHPRAKTISFKVVGTVRNAS